jgi:Telomere resolvase
MGRRAWLDNLLEDKYLPELEKLQDSPDAREQATALGAALRDNWVRDGKTTLRQQQSLMAHTRNVLKAKFGDHHFTLDCIKFSTAEYIQLNNEMQGVVALRNENIQYLNDPQALVDKAIQLLDSPEWADIAAALSVLTGRRSSELLATAKFTAKSPYSVTFTGSLKRRGELQELSFEIPTLATSKQVCVALDKLRQQLPDAGKMTPESVNRKYGPAVARACDKHFTDLVPHREGKDNLYTHLFRSVYATIATFWYCPPQVDPVEYRAAIQGHYVILDEMDMERRRSLAASRHYADYEIADSVISQSHGKRKGIKLGVSVEPIEPFKAPTQEKTPALPQKKGQTSVRIFKEDKNLLEQVLEHLHLPDGLTQPKRMEHLLLWAKDLLEHPVEPVKVEPVEQEQVTVQAAPEPETAQLEPVSVKPEPIPTPVSGRRSREPIHQLIGKIDQLVSILLLQQQRPGPQQTVKPNVLSARELRLTPAGQNRSASAPVHPAPISRTPVKRVDDAAATSAHPIQDSTPQANVLSATPAGQERSAPTRPRLSKYETDDLLEHAVTAILNHNDQAPTHDQKWAITINALKGLGVKSQRKIQLFLDAHKEQIHDHHLNHQIDPQTHNLRHRRKYLISDVIVL